VANQADLAIFSRRSVAGSTWPHETPTSNFPYAKRTGVGWSASGAVVLILITRRPAACSIIVRS
jgi:hypothetical protein